MKELLPIEQIQQMSWYEFYRYYFPDATNEAIEFYLWECTPYPFDNAKVVDAIYNKYKSEFKEPDPLNESQGDLWNEVLNYLEGKASNDVRVVEYLWKHFTVKRRV